MSRQIVTEERFERAYRQLSERDQFLVDNALRNFWSYLESRQAAVGLGIKHLGGRVYEFRAGLKLRIVYVITENQLILSLLGTHDEVIRFLKSR